jgi:SAM-dependent methyltransferase
LAEEYEWSSHARQEKERREVSMPWLRRLTRLSRPFRHDRVASLSRILPSTPAYDLVVDVGCGQGRLLQFLGQRFQRVLGIDISPVMVERARARVGHPDWVFLGLFAEAPIRSGEVDLVTMISYLEHELHPRKVLSLAFDRLKPGGGILIKVPNAGCLNHQILGAKWSGYRYPDHANYFTAHTLRRMLEDVGYQIIKARWWQRFPFNDNCSIVARKPEK